MAVSKCVKQLPTPSNSNFRDPSFLLRFAAISYDYAHQLTLAMISNQTINEYFAEKNGYDIKLLGIVDEGLHKNGLQYNFIYREGAIHGSNTVVSLLHHLLEYTLSQFGHAKTLDLNSDSSTGQNKNNIMVGYFVTRVALGFHDFIRWKFMMVGHTKFRPDEGFGHTRSFVERHVDAF